ncbi:unnamed protein product [Echinostoma caproni]|uniref:H(+)-exporting diphosphatase n=1 Tax=Echinostoma caproni TaxID=27848 RepID=A0A183BGG1_9TREM|nr:unnamed protein product [Echinostoma caproni]
MLHASCLDAVDEGVESVREGDAADDIPALYFMCFCCGVAAGAALLSGVEMTSAYKGTSFTAVAGVTGVREFFASVTWRISISFSGRSGTGTSATASGRYKCTELQK